MFIQITNAGALLLQEGPFQLTEYRLGSGFGYVPDPAQTELSGTELFSGTPSSGFPLSANVVRYSALLDRSVGDFNFGEVGFWVGSDLVALGVSSTLIAKKMTTTGVDGNLIRIDAFLSMVGTVYSMWMNLADTDSRLVVANVNSVDQLPPVHETETNAYVVDSANTNQLQFFAYSNRSGLWAFDQYKYATTSTTEYQVIESTPTSITIGDADLALKLNPVDLGELVLQFSTGSLYSICRNIKNATPDLVNDRTILGLETPMAILPDAGDLFLVYNRDPFNSRFAVVDVATTTTPGIVQVGDGLDVDGTGLLSVDRQTVPGGLVWSLKDKAGSILQGDVDLNADLLAGAVLTVNGVEPDADGDVAIPTDFIPFAEKGEHGGVAELDGSAADDPDDPYVSYVKGRLPVDQAPLESLRYISTWNPHTNSASYVDPLGVVHVLALEDGGIMVDTVDFEATELPGTGCIFRCSTAGERTLDGYEKFGVDDLVVGLPGQWFRISKKAIFQISLSNPGDVGSESTLLYQVVASNLKSTANLRAVCGAPPIAAVELGIFVNGTLSGSIDFAASSTSGTVVAPPVLWPGDILEIRSTGSTHGLSNLAVTLNFTVEE